MKLKRVKKERRKTKTKRVKVASKGWWRWAN
jgi:hypothetical protein